MFPKTTVNLEKLKLVFFNKDKKSILFLAITASAATLCAIFVLYYTQAPKMEEKTPLLEAPTKEQILTRQQLKELDVLREQAGIKPLTEEETEQQTKELETLRKQAGVKPLSEEEIQKQLEELEQLRQAQ